MLNLHLLRIFATLVEQGSFTRAAEALALSQPAVSRGVQELERQLQLDLLERGRRGIVLTEAGAILVDHARRIVAQERAAEADLAALRGLERGRLAIGASSTIGIYLLPPLLGQFRRRYPGIELFLDIGNTQQIVDHLRVQRLDIAFVEGPIAADGLTLSPWREDELVLIAAPEHPLASRQHVVGHDLAGAPFVLREAGSGTREVMEQALAAQGIAVNVAMELGSTEAVKQAVAAGLGLSIVSRYTVQQELALGRLAVVPIADLRILRPLTALRLAGRPDSRALAAWRQVAWAGVGL